MNQEIALNPNKLVSFLNKPAADFTKKDILDYIEKNNIKMLNFRYVGGDGKVKLLNFIINDKKYIDKILSVGERVDGSSLFNYIDTGASDLYVVPRYRTAFVNPFTEIPSVDVLCSYYNKFGEPLDIAPEHIVSKAHNALKKATGFELEALGELEFYISSEIDKIYEIIPQRGYHESHPFAKWQFVRMEAMKAISEIGGRIKYGHSEVGNILVGDREYVQHEIEFLPVPIEEAADQLVLAKWAIREIAYKYNLEVSFAPKIIVGHAGSGMHFHSRLLKNGKNAIVDETGAINDTAKKLIAGYLEMAPSLTAFGNTVPTSFLRLVPHQEAPTNICWGDTNRSALVRVPLGWKGVDNMIYDANPKEKDPIPEYVNNQTVEIRSPDGSAIVHQLIAGLAVAARYGLENPKSLEIANKLYVSGDIGKNKSHLNLPQLPASCHEASERLLRDRAIYEKDGVFPAMMIDGIASMLKKYQDENLSESMLGNGAALKEIVQRYFHCG
ncbi:MAG TPA: glutamine synthetase [Lentisphaeria bacterium]|nr:MAG: glutamine synthetase [Lentisphaerae bacterium GWF2_38_69]HBM15019.1 glutamine synthetase [Lentisphaeria bacterium]